MFPRFLHIALFASAVALASLAPAAHAQSVEQVPLEVRPAQGPVGSSTVLLAYGFAPSEEVGIVLDGATQPFTDEAYADGTIAVRLGMPEGLGIHRVALTGASSKKTAIGTFTTTQAGLPRPAIVAAPRPAIQTPNTARPWLTEIFAVNFSANTRLTLRCPCSEDGYADYNFATTDAAGDATANFDFDIGDYGMIDLGMSEGAGLGGTILAADAVFKGGTAFTPARPLRAVPPVAKPTGRTYFVGSGFPAGANVDVDEDDGDARSVTADAFGGVVITDDDGPGPGGDNPTTSTRAKQGSAHGGAGAARSDAPLLATAGVTNDLVPAQRTTRIVAVGLPANTPVSIVGLDAAGKQAVLATAATTAGGTLDPVTVKIPRLSAAGPYRLEVNAGPESAYTTLGVTGPIDPVEDTKPKQPVIVDPETGEPVPGGQNGGGGGADGRQRDRKLTITVPAKVKIRTLARDGLKVSLDLREFTCAKRCALTGQLLADRLAARTLGATGKGKQLAVARVVATARKTTKAAVRLKLSKKGASRLRRMRKMTFRVQMRIVDDAGSRASAEKKLLATR